MNLGSIIDVAIGLISCYLLLGLVGSSFKEALAGWLNWRGRLLMKGLQDLLGSDLFNGVYKHALVSPAGDGRLPTYVPARNFRMALVAALTEGSQAPVFSQIERSVALLAEGPIKQCLSALLVQSAGDLDALSNSIEHWFDDAMDRLSGYYKRFANNVLLMFGIVVAVAGNVDSLAIANFLLHNDAARQTMVETAQRLAPPPAPGASASPQASIDTAVATLARLDALPVPIGWSSGTKLSAWSLLGWLVTALAVSLGAPFWFDLLQRVLNIRNAGPKPDKGGTDPTVVTS